MQRAAVSLCKSLNYESAGTIEYLYIPSERKYYFLELNPRLQVEHPVTEGITGVSLPGTQIHVAMGIPLGNVPEVRAFYGHDPNTVGPIDLNIFKPHSEYPTHVIAARITAENPDEGFKPTSGKIDRITFQSNTRVWGYFSVTADGGVHEYADSQFGHLFASGPTREIARKNLVMALKELFIMGEIRTTVEYLGELLETDAFKQNTIDTAWLDGLIKEKSVAVEVEPGSAVINAAVYRAYNQVRSIVTDFKDALAKGQLSTLALREMQKIPIEITYQDTKYSFVATPKASDAMTLQINDQTIEIKYREQADGSIYVAYGDESHQLYAKEEPLGLRMVLDGKTVLLPTLYDPSEFRSDVTGKLVRYLVEDGGEVKAGEPYAEAEAMKMIITLKASESGKLTREKQPGSIINQGDLLGSLTLADPSKVKKISVFDGALSYNAGAVSGDSTLATFRKSQRVLELLMDGYVVDSDAAVQSMLSALTSISLVVDDVQDAVSMLGQKMPAELDAMLQKVYAAALSDHVDGEDTAEVAKLCASLSATIDEYVDSQLADKRADIYVTLTPVSAMIGKYAAGLRENAIDVICALLGRFASVEANFAGMSTDQAIAALVKANADSLDSVYHAAFAHEQLKLRSALVNSLLRQLAELPERFGVEPLRQLPPALDVVVALSQLPGAAYKDVALAAAQFGLMKAEKPFDEAVTELKAELTSDGADSAVVSRSVVTNALLALFNDEQVGATAMQVAVKRWYRTYNLNSLESAEVGGAKVLKFQYQAADKSQDNTPFPVRDGMLAFVPDVAGLDGAIGELLASHAGSGPNFLNALHIALGSSLEQGADAETELIKATQETLAKNKETLAAKGIRMVSILAQNPPKWPRVYAFPEANNYLEEPQRRGMYPNLYHLLEIERLKDWNPGRLPSISHNSIVMLGTQGAAPRLQQRVFVRGISHSSGLTDASTAEAALQKALDELQLAVLDPSVGSSASSHLFLHVLSPFSATPAEVVGVWNELMSGLISKSATRLLKLRVDEIEVRAHATNADGSRQAVRLVASSMAGQWLKTDGYLEFLDPLTGNTQAYCSVLNEEVCMLEPYPVASSLATKRSIARRIGTTYAYDFLGLIEKALVKDWQTAIADGRHTETPPNLLEVEELLLDENTGVLAPGERTVGTNSVGMVGWQTTLKTPEFPEGRPLVIVANDCTVQSGSFGVKEDEYFDALSKYSRASGLPRLHLACNSGARIGLAEELKPYFRVAWNDPLNEANGYKYLYMAEADVQRFDEGIFHGEYINDDGEKRFKLKDIVGVTDGIGVENLRGSGLIAGETSAAYKDTFTLSYVTGRSVGIGAYINRLAQRVIQMQNGPMILTGFSALNKLLGKEVYTSQDQLGGPQIMLPNGIAHQLAADDPDGVEKILRWLSYVPKTASEQVTMAASADPPERDVVYTPPNTPYDPRLMLAGSANADGSFEPGFFDVGSFTEYLADWGKSVVVGRARLGGIPMGVIAVETRLVEQVIPADPANPLSRQAVLAQAGQVWYPDSAFKTAQAIADFNQVG